MTLTPKISAPSHRTSLQLNSPYARCAAMPEVQALLELGGGLMGTANALPDLRRNRAYPRAKRDALAPASATAGAGRDAHAGCEHRSRTDQPLPDGSAYATRAAG